MSGDVRVGGAWTPAQRRKNDLIFASARLALALARRLPDRALDPLCAALALLAWAALGRDRRRADRALGRALGARSPGSRAVFAGLGASLADTLRLLRGEAAIGRLAFPDEARRVFTDALETGRGVLLVTAHLGPWERLGAALVEVGLPIATVARDSYDPRFTELLYRRLREDRGLRVLYRGRPGFAAALLRQLRRSAVLALPMDLGGRGVRTVDAPLLGGRWPLALGPAELALRTGAALVLATPMPGPDGRLRVEAERIDAPDGLDAAALTLRIGERLERRLLAWPLSWPWMHHGLDSS